MLTNQVVCNRKCARLLIYSLLVLLGSIVGLLFKRSFHLNAQVLKTLQFGFKNNTVIFELVQNLPRIIAF